MIGYATVGTNDIDKARAFYDSLFGSIGAKRIMEFPSGFTMYGVSPDRPSVAVTKPYDGKTATPGNGAMVALAMDSREKVDALHALALELGGSDEGLPGVRGELNGTVFYGAYFRDLDGNKFCTFCMGPA
jgi:catechol 2,3-dioxygenase-like lactoylglutathione lyase family enzyme